MDFEIYKGNKYIVDNDLPVRRYENKKLTTIELAETMNACPEIIGLLKSHE